MRKIKRKRIETMSERKEEKLQAELHTQTSKSVFGNIIRRINPLYRTRSEFRQELVKTRRKIERLEQYQKMDSANLKYRENKVNHWKGKYWDFKKQQEENHKKKFQNHFVGGGLQIFKNHNYNITNYENNLTERITSLFSEGKKLTQAQKERIFDSTSRVHEMKEVYNFFKSRDCQVIFAGIYKDKKPYFELFIEGEPTALLELRNHELLEEKTTEPIQVSGYSYARMRGVIDPTQKDFSEISRKEYLLPTAREQDIVHAQLYINEPNSIDSLVHCFKSRHEIIRNAVNYKNSFIDLTDLI